MNGFLGVFCLVFVIIGFVAAWRANYIKDYVAARHHEILSVLFLIAAAICFK